ncbi:MAG: type IV pilus twitching motility protein PilT [Candidatus Gastranaerophilales bacterium]|nr:type IV pilus twitching motility protein PilT [Candidatus Gastranaerophilales bacterium]
MLIEEILELAVTKKASDIHISANLPPVLRIDGKLYRTNLPVLSADDVETVIFPILSNDQRRELEQNWELDFGYGLHGVGRFRVNVYRDKGSYAAAFRTINSTPPTFDELGLPEIIKKISDRPRGLILVTGPTGSGKSTTLAAMIDYINSTRVEHILTIEDPIEFIHQSKKCVIHQRELGQDTKSMVNALKSALREDPDVILVGEMRDLETTRLALTAAETGHLVLGTLHTSSASQTIDRIVDIFPEVQQQQIRLQLSISLVAVFSQCLLPKLQSNGIKKGRVMAQEIMIVNSAIANLIREQKTAQIYSAIQTGAASGMQTLDMCLKDLVKQKLVDPKDAIVKSQRPEEFRRSIGYVDITVDY